MYNIRRHRLGSAPLTTHLRHDAVHLGSEAGGVELAVLVLQLATTWAGHDLCQRPTRASNSSSVNRPRLVHATDHRRCNSPQLPQRVEEVTVLDREGTSGAGRDRATEALDVVVDDEEARVGVR